MSKNTKMLIIAISWFLLCISAFIIFDSFAYPPIKYNNYIKWGDRKLKFSDFTLVQGPLFRDIAATTCTGIMMIWDIRDSTYKAIAVFDSEKSRWSSTHTDNVPYLLNHEQKHFDITEYIVRRLNKDLVGKSKSQQLQLFSVYEEQLDMMQKLYDAETNHSVDTSQQQIWNSMVYNLLNQ